VLSAGTVTRWQFYLIIGLLGSGIGCAGLRPEASEASLNEALERADSPPYPTAVRKSPVAAARSPADLESAESARAKSPLAPQALQKESAAVPGPREMPTENPAPAPIQIPPINTPAAPTVKPLNPQREAQAIPLTQPINQDSIRPKPIAVERPAIPEAVVAPKAAIAQVAAAMTAPDAALPVNTLPSTADQLMPALNALAMTTPKLTAPKMTAPASLPGPRLTLPPSAVQMVTAANAAAPATPASGLPAPPVDMADLNRRLDELTDVLESEVRRRRTENAKDEVLPRLEQQLRLMYVLAGRTEPAATGIDSLPEPEREAYRHLLFGLSTWLAEDEATRSGMRNAKVLRSLRDSASELSLGSKLDLSHLTFCEKVEYFGWFTEFPRSEFKPKQQVILYVEVDNFAAEEKGPQAFETELQGSYQIFDATGGVVDERQLPLDREVCRNYRRDYFLAYRIYLPTEIADGGYRLELTIEDLKAKGEFKGRKLGQAMIDFSIRN
jgi:hypothetical protein